MRAVVIEAPGRAAVVQAEDPKPEPEEVVVAVDGCGICGTDLHLLDGESPLARYPLIPGHEFSGEVVEVGRDVKSLRVGDVVAVDPNLPCGKCRFCRHGRENLCEHYEAMGVTRPGACAELVKAPAHVAFRIPDGLPRTWAPLVEPLSCAVHGFDQVGVRLAARYLIYGAGTIGLLLAQLALRAGAGELALVDTNEHRREQARKLLSLPVVGGADELDRPEDWDVVMDATGAVPAIEDGLRRVGRGGTFLVFGVTSTDAEIRFSPFRIYNDEVRIMGSMAVLHSFERALALAATRAVDGDALVTHRVPLDDYLEAVELVRRGEGLKVLVTPRKTG